MTYNANGYAEPKRMVLGIGDLYVNDVFVGNLKGTVTLNSTRNFAYQRPGNLVADIKAEVTQEEVTLEAEICDLKIDQIRTALGINQAVEDAAKTFRVRDIIKLEGTTPVTLSKTAVAGSLKVFKLDRSKEYVETTDWTFATNAITRVPAGSIGDGENIIVEYNYENADARSIAFGGETMCPREFRLDYVMRGCGGQGGLWQLVMWRAIAVTEFELAFNERASGDYTMHNVLFRALVDITKPEGQNLYELREEDGAA